MKKKYMSFFTGAMGLDIGLERAGFVPICYNEIEKNFCKTIKLNRPEVPLYQCDIRELTADNLLKNHKLKSGELFAVVGGPPCQAFSTAGKRNSFNDERGNVFLHYLDLIEELKPKYAIIENVRGLLSAPLKHRPHALRPPKDPKDSRHDGFPPLSKDELPGGALAFIIKKLNKAGYTVSFTLYNAANFGVPQIRERVVILASREAYELPFLSPTHSDKDDNLLPWKTVRDAIGKLKTQTHEHINFPEKRLKFFRLLKSGQNWRQLPDDVKKLAMGKSLNAGGGRTGFYRRLNWDSPAPTIVTSPTMPATDLCHPDLDRPLSVEEYAAIQTFPKDFKFYGNTLHKYKQIGNAVPCKLGEAIGRHLINFDQGKLKNINYDGRLSRYLNTDHQSFMKSVGMTQEVVQQ